MSMNILKTRTKMLMSNLTDEKWEDDEVEAYLEASIDDFNGYPPFTDYTVDNLPSKFRTLICKGAILWGLIAYKILLINRDFNYSDNGLSITIDRDSRIGSILSDLGMSNYENEKKMAKRQLVPLSRGLQSGFIKPARVTGYKFISKLKGFF